MRPPLRPAVFAILALVAACDDPVTPDPVPLTTSLSATEAWARGSIRVILRGGVGLVPMPTVRVGAAPLTVVRHDDTTFTVTLPATPGTVTLQVEQADGTSSSHDVKLHGFVGPVFRPSIEGKLLHVPGGPPTHFFGGMTDGLVRFDVATGLPIQKWGDSTHSLLCSNVVGPGWGGDEIILRGRNSQGGCRSPAPWRVTGTQIGPRPSTLGGGLAYLPDGGAFPVALVQEFTPIAGSRQNAADLHGCTWDGTGFRCSWQQADPRSSGMWSVGSSHTRQRLVTHALDAAIYNLQTGAVVYRVGRFDFPRRVRVWNSTFSATGDTIYLVTSGLEEGTIFQVTDAGALLDSIVSARFPFALAADPVRELLYVAATGAGRRDMALEVYDKKTLQLVTVQGMDRATSAAFETMDYFEVVVDESTDHLYIVGTFMSSQSGSTRYPAAIAKFSLPGS